MINIVHKIKALMKTFDEIHYLLSIIYISLQRKNTGAKNVKYCFDDLWSDGNPTICHALGEMDGILFTECEEAFEKHYRAGSRVFEMDLCLTSDGKTVVIHDWTRFKKFSGIKSFNSILSHEQFLDTNIIGKYTPLDIDRFVRLARKYEDAKFIISAKTPDHRYDTNAQCIFRELFDKTDEIDSKIKSRYILHAYSIEYLDKVMEEYHFNSAIYRCIHLLHPLALAEELNCSGVNIITIASDDIYLNSRFFHTMHTHGLKVIVCVCQRKKSDRNSIIKKWRRCGADMIMTPDGEL